MAPFTWFRVVGPAEVVFRPVDRNDLINFLLNKPEDIPVTIIGATSNILVRDGGIPGVVVRLGKSFSQLKIEGDKLWAGAGLLNAHVAKSAMRSGRSGFAFMSGIPGSVGGGLRMNAGAYGLEFKDLVLQAEAVDSWGRFHQVSKSEMKMGYRRNSVPSDWMFLSAVFKAKAAELAEIQNEMEEIREKRFSSQPIQAKTGGSTFSNPDGLKAWQAIDAAGCRGLSVGGAVISDLHCNFIINHGKASADDIEKLGETVRFRVREALGINLNWEIQRIGIPVLKQLDENEMAL